MPEPKTIEEKRARINAALQEYEATLKAADGRSLTEDETAKCDVLDGEINALKADIEKTKADDARRAKLALLKDELAKPEPIPFTRGQPIDPSRLPELGVVKLTHSGNPHRLLAFRGDKARENAYKAGCHLLACCGNDDHRRFYGQKCESLGVQMLAAPMAEGSNTGGGYLVPTYMEQSIIDLREQYGVFRQEAAVVPMPAETYTRPRVIGNVTVYYPEENTEITASAMKFDNVSLTAKMYATLCKWSTQLDEDAIVAMADTIANDMAWAFAKAEDTNGFNGDGTSTYAGVYGLMNKIYDASGVTYAGSLYTAIAGNTAFSTLDLADFESMVGKLPGYALGNAKWYISNAGFWASMARLIDAAGGNTGQMLQGGVGLRFLGLPVVITNVLNSTLTAQTSTNLLLLGDLRQAAYLGTRRGVSVMVSDQRYFEYNQLGIRGTERVAITNAVGDPVAPTTAGGPVIMLRTPGS